jgi:hypothetical protein
MAFNPLYLLEGRDHPPFFASTPAEPLETAEPLDEEVDDDVREEPRRANNVSIEDEHRE